VEETSVNITVRKFLDKGIIDGLDQQELAKACDREIQRVARQSFKKALSLSRRFVRRCNHLKGPLPLMAYRALARMTHLSGIHTEALKAYLKARRLAGKDPLIRGRIDRALIDVYMYLGDFTKARQAARRAEAVFTRLAMRDDLARNRVNYANVLHRQDKHRDAERLYAAAADHFEGANDRLSAAKCYFNQANTLVQLFDLEQAEKLYVKALEIYEAEQYDLDACDARYGLAWLRMLTGRFHVALLELTACESIYRQAGDIRGELLCSLDRAEVYLSLGLNKDALDAARFVERRFEKNNLRYEQSKAALFRGQAAAALGLIKEAIAAQKRAKAGFLTDKNNGFIGASFLLAADLSGNRKPLRQQHLRSARRLFSRAQLPLWSAVCDIREATDPANAGPALRRLAANRAATQVPHLYALWQTAFGDYEYEQGRVASARKCWRRAADHLDTVRAQLPPVELRTAFGRTQGSPHLRLITSELGHDVLQAAVWSERYKTAGVWSAIHADESTRAARQSVGESLDALARQIATLARDLGAPAGKRSLPTTVTHQALSRLQKRVRDRINALERQHDSPVESVDQLIRSIKKVSRSLPVIQFHIRRNDIIAFVHHHGETSVSRFDNAVPRLSAAMRRWRFILEGELLSDYFGSNGHQTAEAALWADLGEWLWQPLNISHECPRVLILPEGELANIPWPALIVDGQPLIDRHRFIVSPSLRHYLASKARRVRSGKVEIFRGISDNLPHADCEIEALTEHAGPATIHNPALRAQWPATGEARLWHFTGHAELRSDNPFYSYLMLEDGPLFAADFRLKQCRVNLVTLAACRSGEQIAMPGEEATGLVRSLLEMGARTVVAGLWPVSDKSTALWMNSFYNRYFNGGDILDAYHEASLATRDKFHSAYHWAAFSVFGAGDSGGQHGK